MESVATDSRNNIREAAVENLNLNLWEIKGVCEKHGVDTDSLWNDLLRRISLPRLARASGFEKRSGVPAVVLVETALAAKLFVIGSVLGFFAKALAGAVDFERTALYRYLQNDLLNWRAVLYELGRQLRVSGEREDRGLPTALIIDDTTIEKAGRRIEAVSTVHDHTTGHFVLGFKLLALAWFDGWTCRFLDCVPVKERTGSLEKVKRKYSKKRAAAAPGAERKSEMVKDKISLAVELLRRAVQKGFIPEIVMTDSWFTCLKLVKAVRALCKGSVHFLGMVKFGSRKFCWNGVELTMAELKNANKGNASRCRRFKSRYVQIDCVMPGYGEVRIFISRYAGSRKWVALLTTDPRMTYVKAIETYMIRWNIEIGFKETKQLLGLEKCQARDLDSQIAHFTLVFMAHALLVDLKMREEYKSLGILFEAIRGQRGAALVTERIVAAFEEFLRTAAEAMGGIDNVTVGELLESEMFDVFKKVLLGTLTDYQQNWNPAQLLDGGQYAIRKTRTAA